MIYEIRLVFEKGILLNNLLEVISEYNIWPVLVERRLADGAIKMLKEFNLNLRCSFNYATID